MDKPELHLIKFSQNIVDELAQLFFNLTGRKPTEEELEEARRGLRAIQREGSVTFSTLSPATFSSVCTMPEGQWISMVSARSSLPNPK